MTIWQCPHCKSVVLIVGGETYETCSKAGCGGILDRVEDRQAPLIVWDAFKASLPEQVKQESSVNESLARIAEALGADEIGGAS